MTDRNGNGNRDDELKTIRELLLATARRTESNSQAIERLTNKLDRLSVNVDTRPEWQRRRTTAVSDRREH